jgi:hypothetical protein
MRLEVSSCESCRSKLIGGTQMTYGSSCATSIRWLSGGVSRAGVIEENVVESIDQLTCEAVIVDRYRGCSVIEGFTTSGQD